MSKPGALRETMPGVAAWVDELRAAFGPEAINPQIKAGIDGQPTFWASENGVEVGTRNNRRGITLDRIVITTRKQREEEERRYGRR